jgi:tetratricopeptide (TPR) repeat protein
VITPHKKWTNYFVFLLGITLFSTSCKVSKTTQKQLTYKQRVAFENAYFDALNEKLLNNNQEAYNVFVQALEIYPGSSATAFQLSQLSFDFSQYARAIEYAQMAINSASSYNHWYYKNLAHMYNRLGKYNESASVFKQMTQLEPDRLENYILSYKQYTNAKDLTAARDVLLEAKKIFGTRKEINNNLADLYRIIGSKEEVLQELSALTEKEPFNIEFLGNLAETQANYGDLQSAKVTLAKILDIDSMEGMAHFALYDLFQSESNHVQALYHLKKAFYSDQLPIETKMQAVSGYFLKIRSSTSMREEVLQLSSILLEMYPSSVEPYILMSDIYATLGDHSKAYDLANKALQIDKSNYKLWLKLFLLNAKKEDYNQQVLLTNEAIELYPNAIEPYLFKIKAQYNLGLYKDALESVNLAKELAFKPIDKSEITLYEALIRQKTENTTIAKNLFEEAYSYSDCPPELYFYYGEYLLQEEDMVASKSLITKGLIKYPSNALIMIAQAKIRLVEKDYEGALIILNRVEENKPDFLLTLERKLEIYKILNNATMVNETERQIAELKSK